MWLPPGKNSDDLASVTKTLGGDVDAVWPAGKKLKDYYTDKVYTSGTFKLTSEQNTNIDEDKN
ncbi:hypothetical protein BH09BAC5_BH09BAC5_17810 [soil metagenome]